MDGDKVNVLAWERAERYLNLGVGGKKIKVPYFSNDIGIYFRELMEKAGIGAVKIAKAYGLYKDRKIPFGWYRGKGTPEELEEAAVKLANQKGLDLESTSATSIREFMKETGLGIDCSGFVYEILAYAIGRNKWMRICGKDRFHMGSSGFGSGISRELEAVKLKPLDLVLVRRRDGSYGHVAIILKKSGKLYVFQSTDAIVPMGVTCNGLKIINSRPVFGFKPARGPGWQQLYDENRLEFRRLNI